MSRTCCWCKKCQDSNWPSFYSPLRSTPKGARGRTIQLLGIETDYQDAMVAKMRSLGILFRNKRREEDKFKYVMVQCPDDLLIEMFQCKEPLQWEMYRK